MFEAETDSLLLSARQHRSQTAHLCFPLFVESNASNLSYFSSVVFTKPNWGRQSDTFTLCEWGWGGLLFKKSPETSSNMKANEIIILRWWVSWSGLCRHWRPCCAWALSEQQRLFWGWDLCVSGQWKRQFLQQDQYNVWEAAESHRSVNRAPPSALHWCFTAPDKLLHVHVLGHLAQRMGPI